MKHDIYTSTFRGEPVWLVCAGDAPGCGDTIWKTEAEALSEQANARRREAERAAMDKQARKQAETEAAAKAAREDLDGFGSELSPMARGKLVASLSREFLFRGKPASRRDIVRTLVRERWTVARLQTGERVLQSADGSFCGEKTLGKSGIDYALRLISIS